MMPSLTGIKAISFDVDGTLWDFDSAARSALGLVLEEIERLDPKSAKALDVALVVSKPVTVSSLREALAEVALP